MQLILCEKESQAQHIAEFLTMTAVHKHPQHYRKGQTVVAYPKNGHTIVLQKPEFYEPSLVKSGWSLDSLPIIPKEFEYKVDEKQKDAFTRLKKLFARAEEVIVATDPDPDGEGIARNIIRECGFKGPVYRVLYGAMDEQTLIRAFNDIRPISDTDYLFFEYIARSRSDWLVGMNITQAMSVLLQKMSGEKGTFNSGRVILPTVELTYQREKENKAYTPIRHYKVSVDVEVMGEVVTLTYSAPKKIKNGSYLTNKRIAEKARNILLELDELPVRIEQKTHNVAPELPLDTDALIGAANKKFKLSPSETANSAQRLYRPRALTTYPRTEKRHLPESQHSDAGKIISELLLLPEFSSFAEIIDPSRKSAAFDDKEVQLAKQAITPTVSSVSQQYQYLNQLEKKVFFLVARNYLAQFAPDATMSKVNFKVIHKGMDLTGHLSVLVEPGWKVLFGDEKGKTVKEFPTSTNAKIIDVRLEEKMTKPRSLYTRTSLVRKMKKVFDKTDGANMTEEALQRLVGKGIGTAGTRPGIVDKAIKVGLIEETPEKTLIAGEKYKAYRRFVPAALRDEQQSVIWELGFEAIERGDITADDFVEFQKNIVSRLIREIKANVKELIDA